jgi:hypothetical protein
MAIETVISAYNAARGIGSSRSDDSRSSDPDDLMKGRTFIPRMSEASRQALIEAMQKAKKNRQERLAKKKETGEIGSGFPKTDLTSGQGSKADDKLNAVLIRDGIEPIPSDQAETKPKVAPINQTSTNNQNIEEEDPEEEVSDNLVSEQVVGEGPEQAASSGPTSEDLGAAIRRRRSLNENRRRFGPVFERIKNRRERQGTTVGETDNLETPEVVESTQNEVSTEPNVTSNTEVIQDQTSTEKKEKTRGFLRNLLSKKELTPVVNNNTAESDVSSVTTQDTDVDYSTAFQDKEEETKFTSIIEQGLNPTKEQNTYIPKEERTYQIQTGDRGFVKRFSSGEKEPAEGERLAETILAAIKGSIEGELPESNEELDNLVYGVRTPIMTRSDGQGRSHSNLTAEAKYINAMTALGIKDYPDFSELYRQVNGVEPPITSIGIDEFQIDTRYGLYNTKGEKIGVNGQSLAQSPARIIESVFGSSFNWLEDKDKRKATNPEELASLIIDQMNPRSQQDLLNKEQELREQWFQVQNKRVYNGVEDWVERGLEEFKGEAGKLKALNKYSAAMLKKGDLSEEDKEISELLFKATKIAIERSNGFAYGGKIPYYKKKQTLKFR